MAIALLQARPAPSHLEVKVYWVQAGMNYYCSPDNSRQLFLGGLWYQRVPFYFLEKGGSLNWPWLECYLCCVFTFIAGAQMRLSHLRLEERMSPLDLRWQSCDSGGGLFSWFHSNPGLGTIQVCWHLQSQGWGSGGRRMRSSQSALAM